MVLAVVSGGCAAKQVRIYQADEGARKDIVQQAIGVLGKPYRSGAKGPDAFDCSGLIHYVYRQSNILLPVMAEKQMEAGLEISSGSVLPGDLVFFKIKRDFHAGIMLNKKDFIHSSKTRGVAVDSIDSAYWKKNVLSFRTILR